MALKSDSQIYAPFCVRTDKLNGGTLAFGKFQSDTFPCTCVYTDSL